MIREIVDRKINSGYEINKEKVVFKIMDPEIANAIKSQQRQLKLWFKMTYNNRATLNQLYNGSKRIEEKLSKIFPDYKDCKDLINLIEALDFTDGLHDKSAREYHSKHKEEIYYHLRNLS